MPPEDEFYKLEYERAATRYENIYQAIWQNFSYMTVISGAILTFGGDHLQENLFVFLICLPLVFWYLATFVPLNRYGTWCLDRLVVIEGKINSRYTGSQLSLGHYTEFKNKSSKSWWRVRYIVHPSFIVLLVVGGWNLCTVIAEWRKGTPMIRQKHAEVSLSVNAEELEKFLEKTGVRGERPSKDNPGKN